MKRATCLALTLLLSAGCAGRTNSRAGEAGSANTAVVPTVESAVVTPTSVSNFVPQQSEQNTEIPAEFREVDFKNFSYPTSLGKKSVRLKDGSYEQPYADGTGGDNLEFRDVSFADLTGDGKKEAIVQLHLVSCGASCDGGSHQFYFYSIKDGRLALLSDIRTGSLAYECGLKSFILEKRKLTVEVFRECRHSDGSLYSGYVSGKFDADKFTRFNFEFDGRKFALKKREVLPFPEGRVLNYGPATSVSDE